MLAAPSLKVGGLSIETLLFFSGWVGFPDREVLMMKLLMPFSILALLVSATSVQAALIKTKAVADVELGERNAGDGTQDSGSNGAAMNTRWTNTNRNELMAMRFDLTGINFANVTSATLKLTWNRAEAGMRPYIVYGVKDGAVGGDNNGATPGYDDNTWNEAAVVMSTMPGLDWDGNTLTQGIDAADTTNLGGGTFSNAAEGSVEALSASGLLAFLSAHPDNLVTLIVARDTANTGSGQDRFATKDASALTTITGNVGDFAPYLELNVVPEPASLTFVAIAAIALGLLR